MTESMTPEQCREHQRECAKAVREELHELRQQTVGDIAAIRAAVQEIDRSVARIKGYLGINGDATPRPHKRDSEQEEHLHRRLSDLANAVDRLSDRGEGERVTFPRWFVIVTLGVLAVVILLAAFAGPHGAREAVSLLPGN